jgi:acetolactate synthase I/II/III large subunit
MDDSISTPRVADIVARTLAAHGIRQAFGMPGGEVVTLIDALEKAGIGFHLARHETAAAIMAAGAATVQASPGLLVTTVGPGLANAVNGIADAAQEHVPLVVISGVVDLSARGRYTHQVIDHARLLAPLVKASFEVDAAGAGATIARAVRLALAPPMGPVHIDLSPEVAARPARDAGTVQAARLAEPAVLHDDPLVVEIAGRLMEAERPVIIAGFEAARSPQAGDIRRLAEMLGAPVMTTYKGKGVVAETDPLSLGAAGLSPLADTVLKDLAAKADLRLMLGYDPIEMRQGWLDAFGLPEGIIEVSAAFADHGMHRAGLMVRADPGALAAALVPHLQPHPVSPAVWPDGEPGTARKRLADLFAAPDPWGPHAIIDVLNATLSPDDLVTVDSGAHRILLSQKWRAEKPLTLLQSAGFCTMAAALPLAIGASVADRTRRVVAVMGDGGLEMGIGELATLRDLQCPVTIVVFQDQSLALIALKQAASGLAPCGVALGSTDFAAVAQGFGGYGVSVEDVGALRQALDEAALRQSFSLIACRFSADAYQNAF